MSDFFYLAAAFAGGMAGGAIAAVLLRTPPQVTDEPPFEDSIPDYPPSDLLNHH